MRFIYTIGLVSFFTFLSLSQKPALSDKEYDIWNTLKNYKISDNGAWLYYEISPYRGDGKGVIMRTDSSQIKEIQRFVPSAFLGDAHFAIGLVKPQFDTLRKLELDKVKKEKWPKDSLLIYDLKKDSIVKIANIQDFKYAENGFWLAYRNQDKSNMPLPEAITKKKNKRFLFFGTKTVKPTQPVKIESDGKVLTLQLPGMHRKIHIDYVAAYEFSDSAKYLAYVTHQKKNKKDAYVLHLRELENNTNVYTSKTFSNVGKMSWDKSQNNFAFLASEDTNSNNKHFSLYHINLLNELKFNILDSTKIAHEHGYIPSNFGPLTFAEDGNRLFFGLGPKPNYEGKDSLTASEMVKLDLWHWQDTKLQPRQLLSAKKDKNTNYLSFYDWDKDEIHQLENDTLKLRLNNKQTHVFLATNDEPFSIEQDHDYPWKRDEYLIMPQGSFPLTKPYALKKATSFSSILSPDGAYAISYDDRKNKFNLLNISNLSESCLSCNLRTDWFEDLNGQIYQAMPDVRFLWENDRTHVWLLTETDIFRIDLKSSKALRLTEGLGNELNQSFNVVNWDKDSVFIDPTRIWISGFSMKTKESNVYTYENGSLKLVKTIYANISALQKAKNSDLVSYRISTVSTYPDLVFDNLDFKAPKQITNANPQQQDFNWANVELVKWKTKDAVELEGLLYTPENIDINGSYPMIVYYYELNSENIHRHWTPKPTASIVFPTEYCSGGYVIFIPDIRYKPGYPAQSAYDCIMSGTDYVLSKYKFIDSTRMGLQGQSWGGYQSAQLITMTTRYKAAMAGAPVSNMFSAYGGIRWSSGMSRQFQYEHSQSRIGATIWEKPELYTLNSPIFGLPKVKTPLMIMHNDNDGAVPWYQGIELFMGLRRLKKPVWLLNYNGDEHNLMNEAHRRDLSIKMRQFFDFYLNNGEMPKWMSEGIKAVDK